MIIGFLKYYFILVGICLFFAFILWIIMRALLPKSDQPLSKYDKSVLRLNFEKGLKNHIGYLEIANDALSFRSIKDGEEAITVPLRQIVRASTDVAVYTFWATWRHYLRIHYKPDNKSTEKQIVFMFQRNAGIYAEEIKSKINDLVLFKEPIVNTAKTGEPIARETIIAIAIFILLFPLTYKLGRFAFFTISPFNLIEGPRSPIALLLLIVYICGVYWVIYFFIRFMIRIVNKLKKK